MIVKSPVYYSLKKNERFSKGYEMKNPYMAYNKYCEEEDYNTFSDKTFELRLGSVVNKMSITMN
jgi:hypothetical protein